MRNLLAIMAIVEVGAGAALLVAPSLVSSILLGTPLENATGFVVARVAGAALLSLGVACWLARLDEHSRTTTGLVAAMLLYNAAVAVVLVNARITYGLTSLILWPAVVFHALLAVWCAVSLRRARGAGGAGRTAP